MLGDPRWVCASRGLVEDGQGVGVRVEEVGHDEGRVSSREDREVDHGSLTLSRRVATTIGMAEAAELARTESRSAEHEHLIYWNADEVTSVDGGSNTPER